MQGQDGIHDTSILSPDRRRSDISSHRYSSPLRLIFLEFSFTLSVSTCCMLEFSGFSFGYTYEITTKQKR